MSQPARFRGLFGVLIPALGTLLLADACGDAGPEAVHDSGTSHDGSHGHELDPYGFQERCDTIERNADMGVRAASRADTRCSQDADCISATATASCSRECIQVAVSLVGKSELEQDLASIEADYCERYLEPERDCPQLSQACDHGAVAARCVLDVGKCALGELRCPPGCTADEVHLCRGASACDGCPAAPEDALGTTCASPERRCITPGFCDFILECTESALGAWRWTRVQDGCE